MRLNQNFIKTILPEAYIHGKELPEVFSCSIDSRSLVAGEFFCALPGSKADGHDFIENAVTKGASGLIISIDKKACLKRLPPKIVDSLTIISVPHVQNAIQALAAAWRAQFSIPVIGITGSVGKTSTKEVLTHIARLSGKNVLASTGNHNTALGLSLTLLKINTAHDMVIVEMSILAQIARPTHAMITAIGHSHMEGLGSLADIAAEKRDIFKYFSEDSIGVINGDIPLLSTIAYKHPIVKFGCKTINQVQARKIQTNGFSATFTLKLYRERYTLVLSTNHLGRVHNSIAAATMAHLLGIDHRFIVDGIQSSVLVERRFEIKNLKKQRGTLIDDCYNASPESMKAALLAFEKVESFGPKVAVLGDMLELGVNTPFWHRQLGRLLRKAPSLQRVLLVGNYVNWTKKTVPLSVSLEMMKDWQEAVEYLEQTLEKGSVVLVKGSRGVGLNNLVDQLTEA
jgi:UDP-N-acetylmuramoyl-tripeptide--D-alanyl-D-alanine ligase